MPSDEIAGLVSRMADSATKIRDLAGSGDSGIGLPPTAYGFITAVPVGSLDRNESVLSVGDKDDVAIAMAAANSHVAYAWWRTYGDAFHVNPYEIDTIAVPDQWIGDEETRRKAIALGRRLINAITPGNVTVMTSGVRSTKRESLNFHECEGGTIEEIDRLYIEALGLGVEPLLTQLRALRSNNTWGGGSYGGWVGFLGGCGRKRGRYFVVWSVSYTGQTIGQSLTETAIQRRTNPHQNHRIQ